MNLSEFSTVAARKSAAEGQLEQWIYHYLQAGAWANAGLLEGLQKQQRWWLGPLEVELNRLNRCCGPEPSMEYRVPVAAWDQNVTSLSERLADPSELPPLIVVYYKGELSIRDGNHRYEAMRRKGWLSAGLLFGTTAGKISRSA